MNFNEYQDRALNTAIYPEHWKVIYPALGLASEAGEVAGSIKKVLRDQNGNFDDIARAKLKHELGDVLWYVAVLASDFGLSLGEIARENLNKLADRADRGVLGGSGDQR